MLLPRGASDNFNEVPTTAIGVCRGFVVARIFRGTPQVIFVSHFAFFMGSVACVSLCFNEQKWH